jgi:hypothetical protein
VSKISAACENEKLINYILLLPQWFITHDHVLHVVKYVTGKVYNLDILYIVRTVYKMPYVYWAI